jgi:hypothetical protein
MVDAIVVIINIVREVICFNCLVIYLRSIDPSVLFIVEI